MTRKDFEMIAAEIANAHQACDNRDQQLGVEQVADNMAGALANTNPNFDRDRFLKACGVNG